MPPAALPALSEFIKSTVLPTRNATHWMPGARSLPIWFPIVRAGTSSPCTRAADMRRRIRYGMVQFATEIGAIRGRRADWYAVAEHLAEKYAPHLLGDLPASR